MAKRKRSVSHEVLRRARGCSLNPEESLEIALAKAPAEMVAEILAELLGGRLELDRAGLGTSGLLVFQLIGQDWATFLWSPNSERLLQELSRELRGDVLHYEFEAYSGWESLKLCSKGEWVEGFAFGPDYSDPVQIPEPEEDFGFAPGQAWNLDLKSEGEPRMRALFRGAWRPEEKKLFEGRGFLDALLRRHDAYLPGLREIPEASSGCAPALGENCFEAIHGLSGV